MSGTMTALELHFYAANLITHTCLLLNYPGLELTTPGHANLYRSVITHPGNA